MSWYTFGLVKEITDPYNIGYNQGLEDAKKSIEQSFPMLLQEAVRKLDKGMEDHKWNTKVKLEHYPQLAISFIIDVRKTK